VYGRDGEGKGRRRRLGEGKSGGGKGWRTKRVKERVKEGKGRAGKCRGREGGRDLCSSKNSFKKAVVLDPP